MQWMHRPSRGEPDLAAAAGLDPRRPLWEAGPGL